MSNAGQCLFSEANVPEAVSATYWHAPEAICSMRFSPDGAMLACGDVEGYLHVFSAPGAAGRLRVPCACLTEIARSVRIHCGAANCGVQGMAGGRSNYRSKEARTTWYGTMKDRPSFLPPAPVPWDILPGCPAYAITVS